MCRECVDSYAVMEEVNTRIAADTIALHLAEANSAVHFAAFDRLTRDGVDWTCRSDLCFVTDHVPESLIVYDADEYVCAKFLSCDTAVHRLAADVVVTGADEL